MGCSEPRVSHRGAGQPPTLSKVTQLRGRRGRTGLCPARQHPHRQSPSLWALHPHLESGGCSPSTGASTGPQPDASTTGGSQLGERTGPHPKSKASPASAQPSREPACGLRHPAAAASPTAPHTCSRGVESNLLLAPAPDGPWPGSQQPLPQRWGELPPHPPRLRCPHLGSLWGRKLRRNSETLKQSLGQNSPTRTCQMHPQPRAGGLGCRRKGPSAPAHS